MPMLPPLVRDPPPDDRQSSTARPVSARMVRPQRRYASNFNISFVYEPPRPITRPGFPTPESTFDKWRATAAEMNLSGGGAGDPAARGQAAASGVAAAPRRTLHDALLGTTAVVLLGVLGGIGYLVWSGTVPGATAPGGTASKGSGIAAWVQPVVDFAAKAVPDPASPALPGKDVAADTPAPRPALQPMSPAAAARRSRPSGAYGAFGGQAGLGRPAAAGVPPFNGGDGGRAVARAGGGACCIGQAVRA